MASKSRTKSRGQLKFSENASHVRDVFNRRYKFELDRSKVNFTRVRLAQTQNGINSRMKSQIAQIWHKIFPNAPLARRLERPPGVSGLLGCDLVSQVRIDGNSQQAQNRPFWQAGYDCGRYALLWCKKEYCDNDNDDDDGTRVTGGLPELQLALHATRP